MTTTIKTRKCFCDCLETRPGNQDSLWKIALQCRDTCGFCRYSPTKHSALYFRFFSGMSFPKIVELLPLKELIEEPKIRVDILESRASCLSFKDLKTFLEKEPDFILSDSCYLKILDAATKNNPDALQLFILYGPHKNALFYNWKPLMKIIYDAPEKKTNLAENIHVFFLEYAIRKAKLFLKPCLEQLSSFVLPRRFFPWLLRLSPQEAPLFFSKMINFTEYTQYAMERTYVEKIIVEIDPLRFIDNLARLKNFCLQDPLATRFEYKTPKGYVGHDAGGLTKDFYDMFAIETGKIMKADEDGFLSPPRNQKEEPELWYRLGVLLCRSVFLENISPSLSLHPVLVYFLHKGVYNLSIQDFFDSLESWDLPFIKNLRKILDWDKDQYIEFLGVQDEPFVPKKKYIQTVLYDCYLSENTLQFIKGFQDTVACVYDAPYFSLDFLVNFIHGSRKYPLRGSSEQCLETNLVVCLEPQSALNYHPSILVQKLISAIEGLDLVTQKKFFRFWLGTASVSSFDLGQYKPTLVITDYPNYHGCMFGRTCFNQLEMNSRDTRGDIAEVILKTLRNQQLNESVGMRMQVE